MRTKSSNNATMISSLAFALASGLASCGTPETDYSNNEGARAWLNYHRGTVPTSCIIEMIEKYQTSVDVNAETRSKAQSDAMQMAGRTYAISLASEKLVSAREEELALAREGVTRGYVVERAVTEATTKLNEAIFNWELSRLKLAGLRSCNFTATDAAFGFKTRREVSYR